MDSKLRSLVCRLGKCLQARKWKLAVAESCTGGGLASVLTSFAGSSLWFDCGWVTYSNESKCAQLGVSRKILLREGAVSEAVVRAMIKGVLRHSLANAGVAITGIAGPSGGSDEKPVGTVWIAWAVRAQRIQSQCFLFHGNRINIRAKAIQKALEGLLTILECRNK